ncbi:hypothetical protein ALO79_200351 [Pseudomonas syringae pv. castaneae]|uniref:Uncharacterized protein n=1 Tax=Pseudomonas syringae pv. castaneae TaxID=264450 RepID=A0A0P9MWG2_PSESX|nr:hypothetical protein ALO79_200351 [Pseudomonas syringae pv. castaneae]
MIEQKAHGADCHDDDFAEFDQTYQCILGEFFPELPRQRREQKERQDEQQCTQVDPDRAVALDGQPIENGEDQRLLEHIVVECP